LVIAGDTKYICRTLCNYSRFRIDQSVYRARAVREHHFRECDTNATKFRKDTVDPVLRESVRGRPRAKTQLRFRMSTVRQPLYNQLFRQ